MSQLLFDWLNDDVTLSRKIVSFNNDFKDGYMFGELLSKFNQQLNFNEFSTKGTPSSMLNNFCLLEPSMRKIGVHFNSRIVNEIMSGKETATKNLLYEMKTALEGIYRINRQNNNQMLRGTASDKAVAVIKPTRKQYESTISATYNAAIHKTVENANAVMMERAVEHHTSKTAAYLQTMSMADSDQYNAFMDSRYREKEINRHKKEQNDEFARSWEAQNVAQWKVNQRVAHDRRNLKLKVEHDVQMQRQLQRSKLMTATRKDTYDGLDEFSERLDASLLVSGTHNDPDADSLIRTTTNVPGDRTLSLMYIDRATQKKGLESTQKKMKEPHEDVVVRQQKHDQRRRKFIREYDTMQMKMSQKIFETEVIAQILNFAVSEQVEQDLMDKVINYKKIIPDNRRNRTDLMGHMAEDDSTRAREWDAEEARREVQWTIGDGRTAHVHRSEVLHTAVASAERQISTDIALQVLDKVLDVVDWVVACRQVGIFSYKASEDLPVFTAPMPESAPDPAAKKGKEKEKPAAAAPAEEHTGPVPSSCAPGDIVPVDIWADAVKMFQADSPLAVGFKIPSPLMVTDALWPFSLSERPACAEVDWLFSKPFRGTDVLTELTPTGSAAVDGTDGTDDTVEAVPAKNLSNALSEADTSDFVAALNIAEIEVGLGETPDQPVVLVEPEATEIDTLYTPSWITAVQPRHFLGEALVAVRCAVEPTPDEPSAVVDARHIPLRAALCGVSDLARKNLTEALVKQIPGLHVINTADLVNKAYMSHHMALFLAESAASAPAAEIAVEQAVVEVEAEAIENAQTTTENTEVNAADPVSAEGEATVEAGQEPAEAVAAVEEAEEPVAVGPPAVTFADLAKEVYEALFAGQTVSDELYVSMIVHEIKQIPERNNGFLIQDFPTTKKQALLLMEAFSGINFDSRRPQPHDKVSSYAPPSPADVWTFDVKKSGLDMIIHVDNGAGITTAFDERARARWGPDSDDVVYLSDEQTTIKGHYLVHDAQRPQHATGIDLTVADTATLELTAFCRQINLLNHFDFSQYGSAAEAVAEKAKELCEHFIPAENLVPGYIPGTELPVEEEPTVAEEDLVVEGIEDLESDGRVRTASTGRSGSARSRRSDAGDGAGSKPGSRASSRPHTTESAAAITASTITAPTVEPVVEPTVEVAAETAPALNEDGTPMEIEGEVAALEEEKEKYVYQMPPVIFKPNAIPTPLAEALLQMWNTSETQSGRKSNTFFASIRDVRYQMLQRRRAAFDGVSCLLVKLDDRQELFDKFRAKFNQVSSDLRFDPDCVAELHLQTLELCDALVKISETRKQTAETYTKKIGADNVMNMLQHRSRCEAVAMAQSELQRFFVTLHLLFDYTKSVRGYEMHVKVLNELEVALPVTLPVESDGKKDAKKDAKKADKKDATALVPFREPVGLVLVPKGSMEAVPEVNGGDEPVDPKAKKAPAKEKKGAVAENSDPFAEIESRILEEAAKWRKGTFSVTREVYEKDEALCHALEQAIWYEAEKLVLSIDNIKSILTKNVTWLDASEQELVHFMRDMVNQRYIKELAAINHLAECVEASIDDAQPVPEMWLVSPDTLPVNPATVFAEHEKFLPGQYRSPAADLKPEPEDKALMSPTNGDLRNFKVSASNKKLLGKVKSVGKTGFVPEASEHATNLQTDAGGKNVKMERRPTLNANTTNHLRRGSVAHVSMESNVDEQYNKDMAIFHAKRVAFEEKLLKHRAEREREFRSMGMSAATAKLAAYNELLLDEQHDMEDFDTRYKPKRRPASHAQRRLSMGPQHRRPTSAKASVH